MQRIYSIEGNIGAGKTTLLEKIAALGHKDIHIVKEPVDEWTDLCDSSGENILQKFYKDPKTYGFPFQILAFHTRLEMLKREIAAHPECKIFLCERSLEADGRIFAKMLRDDGLIDEISYKIYDCMYAVGISEYSLAGVIWLDVEPGICAERIVKRGRDGENRISRYYLDRCHEYHVKWLDSAPNVVKYTGVEDLLRVIGV